MHHAVSVLRGGACKGREGRRGFRTRSGGIVLDCRRVAGRWGRDPWGHGVEVLQAGMTYSCLLMRGTVCPGAPSLTHNTARRMRVKKWMKMLFSLSGCFAALSVTAIAQDVPINAMTSAQVVVLDECDPTTFNAA